MFNTNATLLDEQRAKNLIEAGLDKIICSVDGYTKEVYERLRVGAKFETVLNNIKYLQFLKKKMRSPKPIVRVQMLDNPINHHWLKEYLRFWGRIADQVGVEDALDWRDKEEDATALPNFACAQLWQRLLVLADGDILPCCGAMLRGTEKLEVLGNVKDIGISQAWQSDKLNKFRKLHKRGESHKIKMCRFCSLRKFMVEQKLYSRTKKIIPFAKVF